MAKMLTLSKEHVVAAWLYTFGPTELRGNWPASCAEAGFTGRSPSLDSEAVACSIEIARDIQARSAALPDDEDMEAIRKTIEEQASPDWAFLLPLARRVMGKIGAGRVQASASQVAALKEIITRAEGKPGQERGDDKEVHILILPAVVHEGIPTIDLAGVADRDA